MKPDWIAYDRETRHLRLDPHAPAFVQDPYLAYSWMHREARTFLWEDLGLWCCSGFDDVDRLLRDRRLGRERPGGYHAALALHDRSGLTAFDAVEAASLLELEPPAHTRLRGLVNRAFVSRSIERLRPSIEALAHRLVDAFASRAEFDLLPAFATPLPATIITEMMGLPAQAGPQLVAWSNDMVRMYMPRPDAETERRADAAAAAFSDFIRTHAATRKDSASDDLLGVLTAARDAGDRLSDAELVSSAILLLNAGHEATVHQIGNAVRTILLQGGDPRRFFATPEAAAATVEECLRHDAPLHLFTRYAYETVEIEPGLRLQPGEQVGLLLGAANRDPRAFLEPDRFDPTRADARHVSFGAGIHFCIGAPLARLELQVALKILFDRLPNLALAERPTYRDSWHFHGLESLTVRPAPGQSRIT